MLPPEAQEIVDRRNRFDGFMKVIMFCIVMATMIVIGWACIRGELHSNDQATDAPCIEHR